MYKAEPCTALSRALRVQSCEDQSERKLYRMVEVEAVSEGGGEGAASPAAWLVLRLTALNHKSLWRGETAEIARDRPRSPEIA